MLETFCKENDTHHFKDYTTEAQRYLSIYPGSQKGDVKKPQHSLSDSRAYALTLCNNSPAASELNHLRPEPSKKLRVDMKEVSSKCQKRGREKLDSIYFISLVLLYQLKAKHIRAILVFCFSYSF